MTNTTYTVIFYLFAAVTVFSAAFVVFSRNIIYSAFSLLFTFFGVAALYVFLSADFIAVTQIMVYVGGILVLLLFGVMFTNKIMMTDLKTDVLNILPGIVLLLSITGGLIYTFVARAEWFTSTVQLQGSVVEKIGFETMSRYVLPFEMVSILLLLALIGAAFLARFDKPGKTNDK
ncbi:MAG: NADH-quinone oxidoreductase subunit J [Chlorobium sp.]|uniref:NADH-quinone oxidoreductase subunit J n=1 Tax=Chlorobium phaeobacteroides (strain BS1) TaxID=331678 RepID=B3EK95_CHLPB|nr:NADH-quinone oxidoreductase subunit J [Chlorobium phaeobacteroides]MCW8796437.1 NADH-quinone oxidoreductase subunit J [Chlorobium sp.]MCW8820122.1 NADH-quinone oxidoreductase subunit J [Ignavibacteriaceae bacterium]NEX13961.1 NADH-quinone oxidoreductase subunit J [Prosthecochloris sp.]MBL6956486.1 NADH-quinone oxidoreductase subunit J [Chlorobium phaeobacteroides]